MFVSQISGRGSALQHPSPSPYLSTHGDAQSSPGHGDPAPLAFCSAGLMSQYCPRLGPPICSVTWTRGPVLSTLAVQNPDLLQKLLEWRSVRMSWNNAAISGADSRREHGWDGMDPFLLLIADCWWSSQCKNPLMKELWGTQSREV